MWRTGRNGGSRHVALGRHRFRQQTPFVRRAAMTDRPVLEPTATHPITVEPTGKHVTVRVNGEVVADTDDALTLQESTYPAVQYIPLRDVVAERLGQRHRDVLPVQGRRQLLPRRHRGRRDRRRRDLDLREAVPRGRPDRRPCRVLSGQGRHHRPHSLRRCTVRSASSFDGPASPGLTLSPLRRGRGDPCYHEAPDGAIWRTSLMRSGPVTARITKSATRYRRL